MNESRELAENWYAALKDQWDRRVQELDRRDREMRVLSRVLHSQWLADEKRRREAANIKAKERKRRRADWTVGVAKIMAEVRRREAERAMPDPPYFTSDNPLDGTRLWDNS